MVRAEQKETVLPAPDLIGRKQAGIPGFATILFPEGLGEYSPDQLSDPDLAQRRRDWLVKKLSLEGLAFRIEKDGQNRSVHFRATPKPNSVVLSCETADGRRQLGQLSCAIDFGPHRDGSIQKKYFLDEKNRSQFEGWGIMQLALSLTIEVLKSYRDSSIQTLLGSIALKNFSSWLSRLHAPDLCGGGYFGHHVLVVKLTSGDVFLVSTYIDQPASMEDIIDLSRECREKALAR